MGPQMIAKDELKYLITSCFRFPSAWIVGVHWHTQLYAVLGLRPRVSVCGASTLPNEPHEKRLRHFNTWFPVGCAVQRRPRGKTLLQEVAGG